MTNFARHFSRIRAFRQTRLAASRRRRIYLAKRPLCTMLKRPKTGGRRAAESINILLSDRFEPFRARLPRINNRVNGKILQGREDFRRKIVKNLRTAPRGLDICAPP